MILSATNKILYANNAMKALLEFDNNFVSKSLDTIAQIKVKKDWTVLDTFIKENRMYLGGKIQSYPQSNLKLSESDEIPINFYMDTILMSRPNQEICHVVTIQDLSKEKERSRTHFRHQLTNLPNQLQAYKDLPAFFSKAHLEKNKLALMLIHFDNFSMLRSILGYEKANDVLKEFARHLETLGISLNISVYHTFDNYFLLTVSNLTSIEEAKIFVEDIQVSWQHCTRWKISVCV